MLIDSSRWWWGWKILYNQLSKISI